MLKRYIKIGIFVIWVITWQAALLEITSSFNNLLFKKKGAISGPVAPIKIELIQAIEHATKNELLLLYNIIINQM